MFSAVTATVSMNWVIDVQGRQTTFLKKMRSKERKKRRWWLDLALGRTQKMAFSQSSNSIVDYKWLDLDEDHSLRAFPTITPGEINTTIRERLLECVKSKKSSQGALRGVRLPCFSLAPQTALKSPIKT